MHETTDATAIFAPVWRRKWLILLAGLIVAAASYFYYKHAARTYSASTQVYLGTSAEEATAGEKPSRTTASEVSDQAAIVNSIVLGEVRRQLRRQHKAGLLRKARIRAKAQEKSLFILITAEGRTAKGTALLVNTLAQTYIKRRNAAREHSIDRAIALSRRQLRRIEASQTRAPSKTSPSTSEKGKSPAASSPSPTTIIQESNLVNKINQLEASRAASGAQQVNPATGGTLVAPKPRQDAVFGFVIGIVLATIAAYALSRLDRRLRTLDGIESIFGSQILAALPKVARPVVHRAGLPAPSRPLLEPLRRLHTMLKLGAGLDDQSPRRRTILFLSPEPGDGKSTLVADLALVQRDSGERVTIVEANFRRPVQSRLLALAGAHGLAEVLSGTLSVSEASQRVIPASVGEKTSSPEPSGAGATTVATRSAGALFLLAGSQTVANPPALLADGAMADLLHTLGQEFDYVLVDAPSPLGFSDVMPLLRLVDGVVLVARAGHTRELAAQRFMQLIANSSTAPILGTVANCVSKADIARRGSSAVQGRSWLGKLIGS